MSFRCGKRGSRARQRGSAIAESMLSMLFISLALFGCLQIFYITVAQMLTEYSSYKVARASRVGLADYIGQRVGQTAVAGASGHMTTPANSYSTMVEQAGAEIFPLPTIRGDTYPGIISCYQAGITWLDYQYWRTGENNTSTSFGASVQFSGTSSIGYSNFHNYPLDFPLKDFFMRDKDLDIHSSISLTNSVSGSYDDDMNFMERP